MGRILRWWSLQLCQSLVNVLYFLGTWYNPNFQYIPFPTIYDLPMLLQPLTNEQGEGGGGHSSVSSIASVVLTG